MRVCDVRGASRRGARGGGPGQPPHDQRSALQAVLGQAPDGAAAAQRRRHGPRAAAGDAAPAGGGADGVNSPRWRAVRGSASGKLFQPADWRTRQRGSGDVPVPGSHEYGHIEAVSTQRRGAWGSEEAARRAWRGAAALLWRPASHDGVTAAQLAKSAADAAASGHAAARATAPHAPACCPAASIETDVASVAA